MTAICVVEECNVSDIETLVLSENRATSTDYCKLKESRENSSKSCSF